MSLKSLLTKFKSEIPEIKTYTVAVNLHKAVDLLHAGSGSNSTMEERLSWTIENEVRSQIYDTLDKEMIKGMAMEMLQNFNYRAALEKQMQDRMMEIVKRL